LYYLQNFNFFEITKFEKKGAKTTWSYRKLDLKLFHENLRFRGRQFEKIGIMVRPHSKDEGIRRDRALKNWGQC